MSDTAATPHFVSYLRVSTSRQGASGLGLEAQREAVAAYIRSRAGAAAEPLREYVEVESGKANDRPQLQAALRHAKHAQATLIIAKLDRLSRNAAFLLTLRDSGARFVAADMPDACDLTIGVLALVAEHERKMIQSRTKAALAVKRDALAREAAALVAQGQEPVRRLEDGTTRPLRLGNPNGADCLRGLGNGAAVAVVKREAQGRAEEFRDVLSDVDPGGSMSARGLAVALNQRGFRSPRGGRWTAQSVIRLRARLAA
ncbi:MAG: resolvase [Mesorhizobium sp.]|uniref:recombinase family protein n=1 Tax=Mesorhizobium sp. TaxID=1871066 RepID=UPI00120695A8|nr:recombinase family protein [Mesorhizobium sp.]TIO76171.1 MAG: resolvase [Mesorhizobium sp.]TIO83125.1 MAG: resolvase [Mesorhizobium sp.]